MNDSQLLKLMLYHITHPNQDELLRAQRQEIIVREMDRVEKRSNPYQTVIQVDQIILLAVGKCGSGQDARLVESGFEVKVGDEVFVYRNDAMGAAAQRGPNAPLASDPTTAEGSHR